MILLNLFNIHILYLFLITINITLADTNTKYLDDELLKMNFAALLNNIVELNENRLGIMERDMKSQNYVLATEFLHNLDDEEKGDSIEDVSQSLSDVDDKSYRTSRRSDKYESGSTNDVSYQSGSSSDSRRWYRPCLKRAAKRCREACVDAVNNICTRYSCSRRVKRDIKKECKINCKSKVILTSKLNQMRLNIEHEYPKSYFSKLLASMVKLNQERYDTINKLSRLEMADVAQVMLRGREDSENSGEFHKQLDITVIQPYIIKKRETHDISNEDVLTDEGISDRDLRISNETNFNLETNSVGDNTNYLRSTFKCNKAVRKRCTRACNSSFKVGCLGTGCGSRIKRAYKSECKRSCKSKFN